MLTGSESLVVKTDKNPTFFLKKAFGIKGDAKWSFLT